MPDLAPRCRTTQGGDPDEAALACPSVRECPSAATPSSFGIEGLLIGEVDGEEPVRSVEALELYLAALGELDPRVRDELPNEV